MCLLGGQMHMEDKPHGVASLPLACRRALAYSFPDGGEGQRPFCVGCEDQRLPQQPHLHTQAQGLPTC